MQITWACVWLPLGAVALALSPLVLGGGRRSAYAAMLCALLAGALGVDWALSARRSAYAWATSIDKGTLAAEVKSAGLKSGQGGVLLSLTHNHITDPYTLLHMHGSLRTGAGRDGADGYPGPVRHQLWGFGFSCGESPLPGVGSSFTAEILFPAWFGICLLLFLPLIHILRRPARRRRLRSRNGLCQKCGYDLRAQNPGDKCPECGTPKPVATAAAGTAAKPNPSPTAKQTQGLPA